MFLKYDMCFFFFFLFHKFYGSWLVLAISYLKLSTLNILEINKSINSLRSVLLRNWKENSGSKKKDSLRSVLLRNWKENSRIKKKDSLRSETQITIHLLKLKDRWRNLWNILGKSLWKTCLLSYKIVREKCRRN